MSYPRDYVLADWSNRKLETNITSVKYFDKLSVKKLVNVSTINDINITDFIILSRHEVIDEEITFEDLEIDGILLVRFDKYKILICIVKSIIIIRTIELICMIL